MATNPHNGNSSDSDIIDLVLPRAQKHVVPSSDDDRRALLPVPKQVRRAVASDDDDDDDDDDTTPNPPVPLAQTAASSSLTGPAVPSSVNQAGAASSTTPAAPTTVAQASSVPAAAPAAPIQVAQAPSAPSITPAAPAVVAQAASNGLGTPAFVHIDAQASSSAPSRAASVAAFRSLAEVHSPLQVLPMQPRVVAPCTCFGAHPRNEPGDAPTFLDMTNLPPPSARLSTLVWLARDFQDFHAPQLTPEALASHIARNAAPVADVGSLNNTPEPSDDEGESGEEDDDDHDDSEEDEQTSDASAGPSASTATPANPLGFDGRTSDKFNATIFLNAGRPTWKVKRTLDGWPFKVQLGFGCRIEHVPGPMPRLKKRPCKMTMRWTPKFPNDQKTELANLAAEEFEMWKPLLGTFAAISDEREKEQVQDYVDRINDAWHYTAKKAECQIKIAAGRSAGVPGLSVREREASQRVWGRPDDTPTRAYYDARAVLPGHDLVQSFQQFKCVYNWLAAASPWWTVLNDHGLHTVTELVVREFLWRQQRAQPRDIAAILTAIDARIGEGSIGIFDLYRFDLIDDTLGRLALDALIHEAGAKGCPLAGAECARGSHLDRISYRNPRPKAITIADGSQLSLGFPVHRLDLLPCSEMASPSLAWDSTILGLNNTLKPSSRARDIANKLFDRGEDGVFTPQDFLTRPLPTCGFKLACLPDRGNKWLAAFLHVIGHHSPASTLTATTAAADAASLAVAPDLLRDFDDLIVDKIPALFSFKGVVNERVALVKRVCKTLSANQPSPDRISSRHPDGTKRNHIEDNMWWVNWWFNSMKSDGSCMRAQLAVLLILVHLFVDVARLPPDVAASLADDIAALNEQYAASGDKASKQQLVPAAAAVTLADLAFATAPTDEEDDDEAGGHDGDIALDIGLDLNGQIKEEEEEEDADWKTADPASSKQDRLWASLRRKCLYPQLANEIIARSPSLGCIKTLMQSLMPKYKDKLENAPKTRFGLPTLGWFPQSFQEGDMVHALAQWIGYEEQGCDEHRPLKPPPAGPLRRDQWKPDESSEHYKKSLEAGMSPANLYGALLLMELDGDLEACHILGVSLKDFRIPITVMGHRIHGLPYTSGFDRKSPTDVSQYRPTSRNFVPESRDGNWFRGGQEGAVLLNNLHNAAPWLVENADDIFSSSAVAAAIKSQIQEVIDNPCLMPARARKMDPFTLVNVVDLTTSRIVFKRLWGHGDLEEAQTKIEEARARADRDGDIERLEAVLPLSDDWTNDGKRRLRDARNAKIAIAAATSSVPHAISSSRIVSGETIAERRSSE